MKPPRQNQTLGNHQRGFSRTDLLVLVAVLSVLAVFAAARMAVIKEKSRQARCTANLREVAGAILRFSDDNNKKLPQRLAGENVWWSYKEQVKSYVGLNGPSSTNDTVFACPSDRGYSDPKPFHRTARFNFSSYVFNGVTLPGMPNIAGWQTFAVKQPQKTLLVMEFSAHAPLSWHASRTGTKNTPFYCDAQSVVAFVDGHVNFSKIYYDGYNAAYTQDPISGYDYKFSGN